MVFVPLTPALLDADYAAVMRDIPMLRAWSGQDWPSPGFTKDENLADLVRHDREQRQGIALTYSVVIRDEVQGCIYVRPFLDALATRGVALPTPLPTAASDVVVRGWAHDLPAESLIGATHRLVHGLGLHRHWWQTNLDCPAQLVACDALGWTDALQFDGDGATWVMRALPQRS